jgi:hypothetical protein
MNPKHEYEVYTSTDKDQRDRLFQALRTSSDPFERQAVKFSGNQPKLGSDGKPTHRHVNTGRPQLRTVYESTWSVAHPKEENF